MGRDRPALRLDRLPAALPGDPADLLARDPGLGRPARPDGEDGRGRQRQQELAGARALPVPALGDRQARDRALGRARLRAEGTPARQPPPGDGAGRAGAARHHAARDHRQGPRHGAGPVRDPARPALGGRRPGPAVHAGAVGHRCGRGVARHDELGATRAAHQLRRPVQGLPRRGLAARPRTLRALLGRRLRRGHRCQHAEVGRPARGAHRLHLRGAGGGAGPDRHAAGDRAVPDHRLRRHQGRLADRRPVRPLHVLRHRRLAGRPDDGQRRHGPRAAAGHRHPAPTDLLRRLLAGADAGGARPAHRLRPAGAGGVARAPAAPSAALVRSGGRSGERTSTSRLDRSCGSSSPAAVPPATPRP